ncbi:MAG: SLBB domain-containing protein [Armatimonadota bacterium]
MQVKREWTPKTVQVIMAVAKVMILVLVLGSLPIQAQGPADYVLGPGDILDIGVLGQSDLTRSVTVRPDGKISLPLIGEVLATGLSPAQLTERLTTALRVYLKEPVVTVTVTQTRVSEALVYLVGEVRNPGSFEMRKGWTVMEAIVQAGGLTDKASLKKSSLIRRVANQTIPLDLDRLVKKGDQSANVVLEGGDVILIPEFLNRVLVMGSVRTTGAFDLREGSRVLDAIVAAGGPSEKAKVGSVGLTRQVGDARVLVATIDLNKIMKQGDQTQNVLVQHADVLFIPEARFRWQDILSYLSGVTIIRTLFGF